MQHSGKLATFLASFLLSMLMFIPVIYGFSRMPDLTVLVPGAPDDLILTLQESLGPEQPDPLIDKDKHIWRFFAYGDKLTLVARSSHKYFECELSLSEMNSSNKVITLDFANESIIYGQKWTHIALLITIRVILTLLIEGLVFLMFQYRKKLSWLVFLIVNLATQGLLNWYLVNDNSPDLWFWFIIMLSVIPMLIVKTVAYAIVIKEHRVRRTILYGIAANLLSFFLANFIILILPMWSVY